MNDLTICYIIFSYLFMFGIRIDNPTVPVWNFLFAPVVLPILLGERFSETA